MRHLSGLRQSMLAATIFVTVLGTAVTGAGPASAATTPPPVGSDPTIYVTDQGQFRSALLHVPSSFHVNVLTKQNVPVIVVLHGLSGSAAEAMNDFNWDQASDRYGFIVTYPDGVGGSWNAGACCGTAQDSSGAVKDVLFLDSLATKIRTDENLTATAPVYGTGVSNGGMMAYRWACETSLAGGLAGIGPVEGALEIPATSCAASLAARGSTSNPAVVAIHGDSDTNVPEDGSAPTASGGLFPQTLTSVNASLKPFLQQRGCNTSKTSDFNGTSSAVNQPYPTVAVQLTDPNDSSILVTRSRWDVCSPATLIEKFVIKGGQHAWPCSSPAFVVPPYSPPSTAMSATLTLVNEWGLAVVTTPVAGGGTRIVARGDRVPCVDL